MALNKILKHTRGKSSLWKKLLLEVLWQFIQARYNLNCILWYMNGLMALFIIEPTGSKLPPWRHIFRRKISAINSHFMTISCSLFLHKTPFDFCKWNKDGIVFPGIILFGFKDQSFPKRKLVKSCRLKSFEAPTPNLLRFVA